MMNPKFIYVFDSLCSWCYAFEPQLKKVLDIYSTYDLQLLSGGMFSKSQNLHPDQMATPEKIKAMYKNVSEKGDVVISDKYIDGLVIKDNYLLNSDRTSTGLIVFKSFKSNPHTQLEFIYQTQQQMYIQGVDPNSDEYYTNVLPNFDIKADKFLPKLEEPLFQNTAKEEMNDALQLGVNSYPQLFLQTSKEKIYHVAEGFTTADVINERLTKVVEKMQQED